MINNMLHIIYKQRQYTLSFSYRTVYTTRKGLT